MTRAQLDVGSRSVPIYRRIVAVEADFGEGARPRWQYGSGLLIGGRQLLTAAHVVQGAVAVTVRRPRQAPWPALLEGALIGEPDRVDLALLDVPEAQVLAMVPVAVVNREVTSGQFIERCWAVGYPEFYDVTRKGRRTVRETAQVRGEIPPLSSMEEGMLSLQVRFSTRRLPPPGPLDKSDWCGMSGASRRSDASRPIGRRCG
jgi:hypothetical protein